jgi:hypothetical protein
MGSVIITRMLLDQIVERTSSNAQAAWNAIMMDFVIIEVEEDRMMGALRYHGYLPQFDALPESECFRLPEYVAEITHAQEGHITTFNVKFTKR